MGLEVVTHPDDVVAALVLIQRYMVARGLTVMRAESPGRDSIEVQRVSRLDLAAATGRRSPLTRH